LGRTNTMHRLATLSDIDSVYSIHMEKDVIPCLASRRSGHRPLQRAGELKRQASRGGL
jgi:hypothetical protein